MGWSVGRSIVAPTKNVSSSVNRRFVGRRGDGCCGLRLLDLPESLRGPVPNRVFQSLYEFTIQHQRRLLLAFTDGSQHRPNIPAQLAPGTAKRSKLNSLSKQGFFFSTDTTHPLPACYTPFHETKGSSQPKPNQSFVSSPPLVSSIFFFYFHFFIGLYLHPPKPP